MRSMQWYWVVLIVIGAIIAWLAIDVALLWLWHRFCVFTGMKD